MKPFTHPTDEFFQCLPSSTAYLTSEAPTAQGPLVDMTILAVTFSDFSLFLEIILF